ncbi:hypothetical protein C2857_002894 [Epichloe festucae Fl1]|uniref:DUF3752 domain-containing protein n=1 Tax=Epichloe festucae (strain Fl1) TaxID=877507 RepID=A0A7S9KNV8_EPIFF|nr:hypothetical protein C2857_002894 [Epichloe festucae Fl1]
MSSIGPQLPADLTKRKRTPDPDDAHNQPPPPSKQARRRDAGRAANNEEIDMNTSDSDQDIGPSAPPATSPEAEPAIPSNAHEIDLSDSDSDTRPAQPPQPQPQPRHRASPSSSSSSEDEDEDDYGPSLPSLTTARPPIGPTLPSSEPAPQRDTWMLAPPPSTSYSERDPTRLRARKFASKPSAKPSPPSSSNLSSIWTETPQEKLRRQRDALLGRAPSACAGPLLPARDRIQEQRDRRVAESIDATRGKSLYDEHSERRKHAAAAASSSGGKIEDDDDPSKRAFDREKDMAVGGKIGTKARTELISKSANFGARFQKGSFL